MQSLLVRPAGATGARAGTGPTQSWIRLGNQITWKRTVVFARGSRVKGALRDPEDVLTANGIRYGSSEENLGPIRTFLNSKLGGKYQLPDKLLLQVITHKSFAHGSQPYNEKLSFFGSELIQLKAAKHAISQQTSSEFAINDKNFDSLGSLAHRLLKTNKLLTEYAAENGLDKVFFRKVALPNGEERSDYKPKAIYSTITSSLVGAIATQYGKAAAEEFIEQEILTSLLDKLSKKSDSEPVQTAEQ